MVKLVDTPHNAVYNRSTNTANRSVQSPHELNENAKHFRLESRADTKEKRKWNLAKKK